MIDDHKTERVLLEVDVDAKLAPLIKELNKVGLRTKYSCEGKPGEKNSAYILIAFDECPYIRIERNEVNIIWTPSMEGEKE